MQQADHALSTAPQAVSGRKSIIVSNRRSLLIGALSLPVLAMAAPAPALPDAAFSTALAHYQAAMAAHEQACNSGDHQAHADALSGKARPAMAALMATPAPEARAAAAKLRIAIHWGLSEDELQPLLDDLDRIGGVA